MAGLRKQAKGDSWQLRVTTKKTRIVFSLTDLSEAQANRWKLFVQAIADSIDFERPLDRKTLEWLASLTPDQRKKLSDKGLIEADNPVSKEIPLSEYLTAYFESHKSELKKASWISYQHTRKRLDEFFKGRTLPSITAMDAKAFRQWLETSNKRDKPKDGEKAKPLAINTIKRRTGLCRQIFKQAIEDGLISRNPFVGMSTSVRSNKERQHYIPIEVFSKVLEKAPNATWRSLLVLARLGALRIPSEAQGLKWDHIAWEAKRISIVASSKTEHHAKRAVRILPLLPAIETELLKLFAEAEEGAEYVFPNIQADTNLRKGLTVMIRRAGVMQWPKLWQNLRASGATDFAKNLPSHVAAAICGHTEQIAQEHYWTITDGDLDIAMDKLSPKLAQKLAQMPVSEGLESSPNVSDSEDQETKKAPIIQGFDDICRLMSSLGISIGVDDIGLDMSSLSLGKSSILQELAQKLAQFDIKSLWKTLGDSDRLTLFAVAASLAKGASKA